MMTPTTQAILHAMQAVVATIPPGRVMSYGAVARAAGYPRHVRLVARALALSPTPLPWQRVLDAQGRIPPRGLDGEDDWQRLLLENEGIVFTAHGRVPMRQYAWQPTPAGD